MINYIRDKTLITQKVLELSGSTCNEETLEYSRKVWWSNIRKYGGLGLTSIGNEAFLAAGLEYWDIPVNIEEAVKLATRLALDKHIPCPWFLMGDRGSKTKRGLVLRLYDSRVASMAILHGGLTHYLDNLKRGQ